MLVQLTQHAAHILCAKNRQMKAYTKRNRKELESEMRPDKKFNCNNLDNSLHSTRVNRVSILKYKLCLCTNTQPLNGHTDTQSNTRAHTNSEWYSTQCTNIQAHLLFVELTSSKTLSLPGNPIARFNVQFGFVSKLQRVVKIRFWQTQNNELRIY